MVAGILVERVMVKSTAKRTKRTEPVGWLVCDRCYEHYEDAATHTCVTPLNGEVKAPREYTDMGVR
jgi:hypothetical protein